MFYFILLINIVLLNLTSIQNAYGYPQIKAPKEEIENSSDCKSILLNSYICAPTVKVKMSIKI